MSNNVAPPEQRFSKFGTAPESPPDDRDHLVRAYRRIMSASQLPDEVGMENVEAHRYIGITNQMQEGSCTGQAGRNTKTTLEIRHRKTKAAKRRVPVHGARGIYHLGKTIGGYPEEEGAYMRDVAKAMSHYGVPREVDWPYVAATDDNGRSQDPGKPNPRWLTNAKRWKIGNYARIRTLNEMLTVLHTMGPIFMAMDLHDNFFEHDPEGLIPSPRGQVVGAHAMCILAAVQSTKRFYVANSWDVTWGKDGYCWIGFDHFQQVRGEAWAIPDYVTA